MAARVKTGKDRIRLVAGTRLGDSADPSMIRTAIYWVTTLIIALESAVGGVWDILRIDYVREVLETQLGYPPYVAIIIGICKLPGALVLLAPRLPRLKEWVYAGVVFIYTGAVVSHLAVGDVTSAIGPLGFTAITFISWASRPASRRQLGCPSWAPAGPGAEGRSGKAAPRIYWATTGIIAFVLLTGGFADLLSRADTAAGVVALGYPTYFVLILGVWKILGTAAVLVPGRARLKEWAYAGAFYNFAGALVSHLVSGSAVHHVVWTALFAACTLVSWALRSPERAGAEPRARTAAAGSTVAGG